MSGPRLSPLGNGIPSLVHNVVRVSLLYIMPSCGISEQTTLRASPADITLLKGFILKTGAEGTTGRKQLYINNKHCMIFTHE